MKQFVRILMISLGCQALTFEYIPDSLDPPSSRIYHSMTLSNNTLFLFGGQKDNSKNFNDMWVYSLSAKRWTLQTSASQTYPIERFSHGAFEVVSLDLVCVFGGTNQYGPLNDLWCFSIRSTNWILMNTYGDHVEPRYRFGYTSYMYNNTPYFAVFGGHSKEGRLNDIALLNLDTWTWTVYNSPGAPSKRNGCMLAQHSDYLYVAGGSVVSASAEVADMFRFHISNHTWEDVSNLNNTYKPVILSSLVALGDMLYLFFGWSTIDSIDLPYIYAVDLTSGDFSWTEVASFPELKRDSFGYTMAGSQLYIFGGFAIDAVLNDLVIIDLSVSNITYTKTQSQTTPPLRVSHTMEAINDQLYIFGGDSNEEKLNDLWGLDVLTNQWTSLNYRSGGTRPSPRSHHASASSGDNMIIWGGDGTSGLLNDIYRYSFSSFTWEELFAVSSRIPAPRKSPCLVLANPFIYMYGGMTETQLSSELWQFDIGTGEYTLLNSDDFQGPGDIHKQKCYYETVDGEGIFYVVFGTGLADQAEGKVHSYSFKTQKWSLLATSSRPRSGALVVKVNDKIIIGGGEKWGINLFKDLFYIDLSNCNPTCEEKDIGELDAFFLNGAGSYSLSSLYFHGGSSPMNDIHRVTVPSNALYKLDLLTACSSCQWDCSLGSEIKDQACVFCPRGHYSEVYSSPCEPCSEGFYNEKKGARSHKQCFPCSEGTFNPDKGAYYCLDCPAFATCSIGSSQYHFRSPESEESTRQPSFYESQREEASEISNILVLTTCTLGAIIICAFVFWGRLSKFLAKFDLFDKLHTHGEGNVVTLTKNKTGGTFGLIFMIVALIMVMSTLPDFLINNLAETKTLVPYIIVEESHEFFTHMILSVELENYQATCEDVNNSCDSSIIYTASQLENKTDLQMKCFREQSNCKIEIECEECAIDSSSKIRLLFTDTLSYTSGILANITAFSSIPDSYSSASYHLYSPDNTVFKGSPGTAFYFTLIPSLFRDSINGDEATGYHAMLSKFPEAGASHSTIDVPFTNDLEINIEFYRSENSLMTLHEEKIAILILFITLLGSISGALGAIGAGMSAFEKFYKRLHQKYNQQKEETELLRQRKDYKMFLNDKGPETCNNAEENNPSDLNKHTNLLIRSKKWLPELSIDNIN